MIGFLIVDGFDKGDEALKGLVNMVLLGLIVCLSTQSTAITSSGELGYQSWWINSDGDETTADSGISAVSQLRIEALLNSFETRLLVLGSIDSEDSSRNEVSILDGWVRSDISESLTAKIGIVRVNQGFAEVFKVMDTINPTSTRRNLIDPLKLGEPGVSLSYLGTQGGVTLYYFPWFTKPKYPDCTSRLHVGEGQVCPEDLGIMLADESDLQKSLQVHQAGLSWQQSWSEGDLQLHYFRKVDSQRFSLLQAESGLQRVYHVSSTIGFAIQQVLGLWTLRSEALWQDYPRGDYGDQEFLVRIDSQRLSGVLGSEYLIPHDDGSDTSLLFETKRVWTIDGQEASDPFTRDGFLGVRHQQNDIKATEITAGLISDLRNLGDAVLSLEYQRRLGEKWQIELEWLSFHPNNYDGDSELRSLQDFQGGNITLTRFF